MHKPLTLQGCQWSGCGFDLKMATPTPEQVQHAVHVVVSNPKYRDRVSEMKEEVENYDSLTKIARKSVRWQRVSI